MSGVGSGAIAAEVDVAAGAVVIEAQIEFEAGIALHAKIKAVDQAAGVPIKGEGAADEAEAVLGIEVDRLEVDDLSAG